MGTFSSYFREQNQPLGFILKHPVVHTYFPLIFFAKIQQTQVLKKFNNKILWPGGKANGKMYVLTSLFNKKKQIFFIFTFDLFYQT